MYAFDASTFDIECARAKWVYLVPHDCVTVEGERRVPWNTLRRYISDTAWTIWAYLSGLSRNSPDREVWPSVATLLRIVRRNGKSKTLTERSLYRALERLRQAGLVTAARKDGGLFIREVRGRQIPSDSMALYVPENTCKWLARAKPMNRPKKKKDVRGASKRASGGEIIRKESREKSKMPTADAAASLLSSAASPPSAAPRRRTRASTAEPRAPETPSVDVAAQPSAAEMLAGETFGEYLDRLLAADVQAPEILRAAEFARQQEEAAAAEATAEPENFGSYLDQMLDADEPSPELVALFRRAGFEADLVEAPAAEPENFAEEGPTTDEVASGEPSRPIEASVLCVEPRAPRARAPEPPMPADLGDLDPSTHGLRAGGPDARRELHVAQWRDEVMAMPVDVPVVESDERSAALLDSLFEPFVEEKIDAANEQSETPEYDYDDPRSFAGVEAELAAISNPQHVRTPLDLTGLLPEFPSDLPSVQAPRFEGLKHLDGTPKELHESVLLLARSFRMAMNGHYGGKFHQLRRGDITKSPYYDKLAKAAEMLRERNIYPGLWCFWAIKRWREKNPVKQPPLGWVFSPKLIASCTHWFDESVRAYQVQHRIAAKAQLWKLVNDTRRAAMQCATRAEAIALIEKRLPPELWRAMCRRAHDEAHELAADIRSRFANEEWVWGKF
jgi:DNA-binding transcriptional ArsR family regulator